MNLDNIVSVSGLPGLYKMAGSRNNGLIIEDLDSGKRRFVSVRKHQFTPLESVSIYTMMDTTPLPDVFKNIMSGNKESIPQANAASSEIQEWFSSVLPNYDADRVLVSDMRKIIRWYNFLESHDLLTDSDEEE